MVKTVWGSWNSGLGCDRGDGKKMQVGETGVKIYKVWRPLGGGETEGSKVTGSQNWVDSEALNERTQK